MPENASIDTARRTWEAAAPGWVRWEPKLAQELSDATETLIDMAAVRSGMDVLDVACGAGSQTLRLAERVGSEGSVTANDISATMLQNVRASAADRGFDNIRTLESAAEELDQTVGPYDAAISRLGLMLFPAPRDALAAIRRVLRPGARFAAMVFTTPPRNPYMSTPMKILLQHAGKEPPPSDRPGLFALGGDGVLPGILGDSGFADVKTRVVQSTLTMPDAASALVMMQEAYGALRAMVADLSPEQRERAWEDVLESLREFEKDGEFRAELEFVISSGVCC